MGYNRYIEDQGSVSVPKNKPQTNKTTCGLGLGKAKLTPLLAETQGFQGEAFELGNIW